MASLAISSSIGAKRSNINIIAKMTTKTKIFFVWIGYLFWLLYLIIMVAASIKAGDNLNILFAAITFVCGIGVLAMAHRNLLKK